ncbi:MAG: lysophospholipase [Treponema sp.]|nr:lysophospholipase [Treponema sp.]
MQIEKFMQKMNDGAEIAVNRWIPEDSENVKAVLVFCHGMLEHSLRYDRIGSIFAENGFVFSAHDLRGHGKTAQNAESKKTGKFGVLADKDGFNVVTDDYFEIVEQVKKDFPGKAVIAMGHSFGSFVVQNYIEKFGDQVNASILMGTSGKQKLASVGRIITSLASVLGRSRKLKFIQNIAFSGYNSRIKKPEHSLEWLCANKIGLELYKNDSWCGGLESVGFFNDLANGLCQIHKISNINKIPSSLPVLILAGSDDPVGDYGNSIRWLMDKYTQAGITKLQFNQYQGDRHELFNENDCEKVLEDIFDWIEKNVSL